MSGKFACPKCGSEGTAPLAQSVAPPPKKNTLWGLMIVFGLVSLFSLHEGYSILSLLFSMPAIGAFTKSQEASDYNEKIWPRKYKAWENGYLCHRCGHHFQLKD